ncbi:MAG: phosphoribosylformylglycinamidine synthase [Phycisphaeraceae bacterium]|nr:MAG: phosphoribosylformylglycinamidine synthase [Phycisphaeraceae bacterium]
MSPASAARPETQTSQRDDSALGSTVRRVEVASRAGRTDPRAEAVRRQARTLGLALDDVRFAQVYLIEARLDGAQLQRVAELLLASPVLQMWTEGASPAPDGALTVEVHPLPGVMDPAAQTVRDAVREITGLDEIAVSTGRRYDMAGVTREQADLLARRLLANPVVHAIHAEPWRPQSLPRGGPAPFEVRTIDILKLTEPELEKLSREAHLFLSLDEMKAVQAEFRRLGREPTDIELETLAQTWSEHCVHKTLKSNIRYRAEDADDTIDFRGRPGHTVTDTGEVVINNLLRSTVVAATHELIADGVDWTLSVFVDNAGIIAFDDEHAVCVKVETHNHPSAIEPYGGAATGAGGCIRDIIGTGLGAKPIANTDVFCVAYPDHWVEKELNAKGAEERGGKKSGKRGSDSSDAAALNISALALPPSSSETSEFNLPAGCLHPRRILNDIVAGVRDYGNRMGIPTLNGAVWFDDRHVGNPLVFCGCVGVMPRRFTHGDAQPGDRIVALGGRTGRDGIHGATFSSAELTDTHADEFSHAVQIGNAIEEKRVLDAILRARDAEGGPLYTAITDCGAGGFSSAVGEMGEKLGAEVHLERAPLKYDGLTYTEIWISEAQERMVLAVPPEKLDALRAICAEESVELCELGEFGTEGEELILRYTGKEVGRLSMKFLHDGIPTPVREATWKRPTPIKLKSSESREPAPPDKALLQLLAHPNIASKRWIVRQYDHEVQGATLIKPLVGAEGEGPGDASVIEPVPGTGRGLAIGAGLATGFGDPAVGGDPYLMALAAIDECVRNLVCVGADPERIAILDNFCWPSCARPENLGALVRAAEGCYDGAKAYRTPFVSGKDSLNNQFTTDGGVTIEIPPTLLISGIGVVPDVRCCVTMDAKRAGNRLLLVGRTGAEMGGSHAQKLGFAVPDAPTPRVDLREGPRLARAVAGLIERGLVSSAHDCSEGGALVAVAEMLIGACPERSDAGALGADIDITKIVRTGGLAASFLSDAFGESPSRYVLEVEAAKLNDVRTALGDLPWTEIGEVTDIGRLRTRGSEVDLAVQELKAAWLAPLDW